MEAEDHSECAPLRGIVCLRVLHDDCRPKVLEGVRRVEDNLAALPVEEDLHSDHRKKEVEEDKVEVVPKTTIVEDLPGA